MTYTLTLETFNGSTKKINLSSKGQVAQFINTYPTQLPVGIAVKVSCDTLGIRGTIRGNRKQKGKQNEKEYFDFIHR